VRMRKPRTASTRESPTLKKATHVRQAFMTQ
jgi:hypothetical protein